MFSEKEKQKKTSSAAFALECALQKKNQSAGGKKKKLCYWECIAKMLFLRNRKKSFSFRGMRMRVVVAVLLLWRKSPTDCCVLVDERTFGIGVREMWGGFIRISFRVFFSVLFETLSLLGRHDWMLCIWFVRGWQAWLDS